MSTYDDVVKDVAEDLDLDEAALRATFSRWLQVPRSEVAGRFTPEERAQCYAVYRLTKGTGAFRSAMNTVERRTGYIRELADAVLSMEDQVAMPLSDNDARIALAKRMTSRYRVDV